jgi:hypothetical protein
MGAGETGVSESPGIRPIGPGGIPMKKKVMPKKSPKKLKLNKNWHESFGKFSTGGKRA